MSAQEFHLVTHWQFNAPLHQVWDILIKAEDLPQWWPAVTSVQVLAPGDANGIGAIRRMLWRTALPYTLSFDMRTTSVQPMTLIEAEAYGELDGLGRWTLHDDSGITHVRYDWIVKVTKPWMRLLAPLLRPVFAWNHQKVMAWGLAGIRRKLES